MSAASKKVSFNELVERVNRALRIRQALEHERFFHCVVQGTATDLEVWARELGITDRCEDPIPNVRHLKLVRAGEDGDGAA